MIISCPLCIKSFEVDENLIPEKGRLLKCGSCDQTWFFEESNQKNTKKEVFDKSPKEKKLSVKPLEKINKPDIENLSNITNGKGSEIIKYQPRLDFTFSTFLSYMVVIIISFISLIIILDTFKSSLYNFFPNLEYLLFSLYEILKDIKLFIIDIF